MYMYMNQTTGGLFQEEVLIHLPVFPGEVILSSYTDRVTGDMFSSGKLTIIKAFNP